MKQMGLATCLLKGRLEAGIDEAGRGCLAGPVTAAAVIPGPAGMDWLASGLNDSKQLNAAARAELRARIESEALAWAVGWATVEEIERVNILQATYLAMHRAVDALAVCPDHLLVDGNRFQPHSIAHTCEIKGDGRFLSIAAASILAKTHRDERMNGLALQFPQYGWASNMGYPTPAHKKSIQEVGHCLHHRKTFRGVQGSLFSD